MSTENGATEKKVILTKMYKVTIEYYEDGTNTMIRMNDGFNGLELIGLSELITFEVREQLLGNIRPDIIKREVVELSQNQTNLP